jgi:hypothetical protein
MPNGQVSQVNMTTQRLAEFNAAQESWERNSDQKSFTFEVATGEALPSGTPFRLGVLLTSAVNTHFGLKREVFGLFLKRMIKEQVFKVFKSENKEKHTMPLFASDEGVRMLKDALIEMHTQKEARNQLLRGIVPQLEEITAQVQEKISKRKELFVEIPDDFYDNVNATISIEVTGESVDIPKKIETLTNLYNVMTSKGDPRADVVLERILSYTGENINTFGGNTPPVAQPVAQTGNAPTMQPLPLTGQPNPDAPMNL